MGETRKSQEQGPKESILLNESKMISPESPTRKKDKGLSLIFLEGLSEDERRKIKHSLLKNSKIGRNMTTSIEIESELNNLFGSDDFSKGLYDAYASGANIKNSVLSKVAEEFE